MNRLALLTAALLVSAAAPAARADDYVPTFTPSSYWLHANTTPLGNVDAHQSNAYVKWDATRPTGTTTAHYAGLNYATIAGDPDHTPTDFLTMQGTVKGDLDNLAFTLYFVGPSQATIGCSVSLAVELKIDGKTVISQDYTGSNGFASNHFDQTTEVTNFALTHLWDAAQQLNLKLASGPDAVHNVYVNLQNFYACNEFVWRYDSATYPSGFTANLADLTGYSEFDVTDPPAPVGG